jgi:hypothetical protein
VLAPVLVSLTMIGSAVMVIEFEKRGFTVRLNRIEWILILAGAITVLYTFTEDYTGILIRNGLFAGVPLTEESPLVQQLLGYIPSHYNWFLFILGELMIVSAVFLIFSRVRHENA